jgi:hypothetical protein
VGTFSAARTYCVVFIVQAFHQSLPVIDEVCVIGAGVLDETGSLGF